MHGSKQAETHVVLLVALHGSGCLGLRGYQVFSVALRY